MIEFPSVCHVLFQLLDFMVARSKKQEKKNLLPYELEMVWVCQIWFHHLAEGDAVLNQTVFKDSIFY